LPDEKCPKCGKPMKSDWVIYKNANEGEAAFLHTWCQDCEQKSTKMIIDRLTELIGEEIVVEVTTETWGGVDGKQPFETSFFLKKGVLEEINGGLYDLKLVGETSILFRTEFGTFNGGNQIGGYCKKITKIYNGDEVIFSIR
jgi:hypothetical protein